MDSRKTFCAKNSSEWRAWLEKKHNEEQNVWLQIFKKKSKVPSITLDEAIDEALSFGWIDKN